MSGPVANEFVYCMEALCSGLAKVGATNNPPSRIGSLAMTSPYSMQFRHVVRFDCRLKAAACEKHILATATRHRGEWMLVNPLLDNLFIDAGLAAENVTAVYQREGSSRSPIRLKRELSEAHQGLLDRVNAREASTDWSRDGRLQAKIEARLADGYGTEDLLAMDGIPLAITRSVIARHVAAGTLAALLRRGERAIAVGSVGRGC